MRKKGSTCSRYTLFLFLLAVARGFLTGRSSRRSFCAMGSPLDNIRSLFSARGGTSEVSPVAPAKRVVEVPGVDSWEELQAQLMSTHTGQMLRNQRDAQAIGEGLPHTDAKLRMFGSRTEPRVTLYRDSAAWCPYCQKVWMMFEEKQIPYKIEKINMRAYGDKPRWFTDKVPGGLLPVIELDGKIITESAVIMSVLEQTFAEPNYRRMLPTPDDSDFSRVRALFNLERQLFGAWCQFVFRPGRGMAERIFLEALDTVEGELGVTEGPWFLRDPGPSIVDLVYVSHIERMCASVAFWKGIQLRNSGRWPRLNRWFDAFELRPSYQATKSDFYTHVMDIPPQYGDGYFVPEASAFKEIILGGASHWRLPLSPLSEDPLQGGHVYDPGDENARHEAAFKLIVNAPNVVKFALRGAGHQGNPTFSAPLADPYAQPALQFADDLDVCLRHVAQALLVGCEGMALSVIAGSEQGPETRALVQCAVYLRDRVGVPRDMSLPAARQLRAHLNWLIDQLQIPV